MLGVFFSKKNKPVYKTPIAIQTLRSGDQSKWHSTLAAPEYGECGSCQMGLIIRILLLMLPSYPNEITSHEALHTLTRKASRAAPVRSF